MASVSRLKSIDLTNFLWLFLCLGVAFFAVRAFTHEYRSAVMVRSLDAEMIEHLRASTLESLPVTVGGAGELMEQCAVLLLGNPVLRMNPTLSGEVGESCADAAETIISGNPAFARAYAAKLVANLRTFTAGDYIHAAATAPFEPWPLGTRLLAVERRVALGGMVEGDLADAVGEDIARAAQSDWGRRLLASLYMRRPEMQTLIQSRLETRPEAEQAGFLRVLRQVTNR